MQCDNQFVKKLEVFFLLSVEDFVEMFNIFIGVKGRQGGEKMFQYY